MNVESLLALEKLNELTLSDAEQKRVFAAFEKMSGAEAKLSSLNTESVERMVSVVSLTNILREDISSQPFSRESLLEGAPEHMDGYWQVPRLID